MKRTVNRLLSFLLCVCLLGLIPCVTANAAETVTETKEVTLVEVDENGVAHVTGTTTVTDTYTIPEIPEIPELPSAKQSRAITNEDNSYYIETFADLQELAAGTYDSMVQVWYHGTEPFVISENLALPEHLQFYVDSAELTVPKDVTLTICEYVSVKDLVVNGTVNVEPDPYGSLYISNSATITGVVNVNGSLAVESGAQISGAENVVVEEYGYPYWNHNITDGASLKAAAEAADADTSGWNHSLFLGTYMGELVLNESVNIPANCDFVAQGPNTVTIAADCELTVNNYFSVNSPIVVNGTLNNKGSVYLRYDDGGSLTIAEGGSYTGSGRLFVYSDTLTDVAEALPGLDLTEFQVNNYSDYWELRNAAGLTKLGTPTDLLWGYDTEYNWDSETETSTVTRVEGAPGMVSWKTAEPDQAEAEVDIYRVDGDTDVYFTGTWWSFGSTDQPEYRAVDNFILADTDPETGTYYFTVQSKGDNTQYYDSDVAVSGYYEYVNPGVNLAPCTNLSWNGKDLVFEHSEEAYLGGFYVEYYYAATAEETPRITGGTWSWSSNSNFSLPDWVIEDDGEGYYYFKIRALTSDIEKCCNSAWSELSPAYHLTTVDMGAELDSIISDSALTTEEKVEAVQELDTEELKTAMLASDAVVDQIAGLEEEAGGAAAVEVTDEASDFDAGQVSIVGANLNTTTDADQGVTLVIDKPQEEHVIPEAYANAVSVSFSMDLENVADTENLEVPVQITLPVPSNINPNYLVILHYHANGDVEEIWPYIYNMGGQYYAEFVLSSFSDFVMIQTKCDHVYESDSDMACAICGEIVTAEMYRLYNPNNGQHHYTGSREETQMLVEAGWVYEGVAWNFPIHGGFAIYRVYNPNNGDHHYTGSQEEVNNLVAAGWIYEGIAFNSPLSGVPVYRLFNPNALVGTHHYTPSEAERDMLVDAGWSYEAIAWNAILPE